MRFYYRVTTSLEHEYTGAGLGYHELYGEWNRRYHWAREDAEKAMLRIEAELGDKDPLRGTYRVEERLVFDNDTLQDDRDHCAREQLGV